jgi:hypothetical protein
MNVYEFAGIRIEAQFDNPVTARLCDLTFSNTTAPTLRQRKLSLVVKGLDHRSKIDRPAEVSGWTIIGADVAVAPWSLWFRHDRLTAQVQYRPTEGRLEVLGHYKPRIDRRLRGWLPFGTTRWENAIHELRASLFHPLFWMLSELDGVTPLHASVVSWDDVAMLICGMNGSGKSTLCARAIDFGASMVADNYGLVTADRKVLPFPELARRLKSPGEASVFKAFGKAFFRHPRSQRPEMPLGAITILVREDHFSLDALTPDGALSALAQLQRLTPEFVEDTPLCLLGEELPWYGEIRGVQTADHRWQRRLREILEYVPTYRLSLPAHQLGHSSTVESLRKLTLGSRVARG